MYKHIPAETKKQVIDLYMEGMNGNKISNKLGLNPSSVYSIIKSHKTMNNKISKPEVPSAFKSLEDAVTAALFCKMLGFDSERAGQICRDFGCNADMLKEIAKWHLQDQQERALEQKNELKALHDNNTDLTKDLELLSAELAKSKYALAEFGQEMLLIKAEYKKSISDLAKEHKKSINALEKERTKDQYKLELAKKVAAAFSELPLQKM